MTTTLTARIGPRPAPRPGRCPVHALDLTPSGICGACRADALAGGVTPNPSPLRPARPGELRAAITRKATTP